MDGVGIRVTFPLHQSQNTLKKTQKQITKQGVVIESRFTLSTSRSAFPSTAGIQPGLSLGTPNEITGHWWRRHILKDPISRTYLYCGRLRKRPSSQLEQTSKKNIAGYGEATLAKINLVVIIKEKRSSTIWHSRVWKLYEWNENYDYQ